MIVLKSEVNEGGQTLSLPTTFMVKQMYLCIRKSNYSHFNLSTYPNTLISISYRSCVAKCFHHYFHRFLFRMAIKLKEAEIKGRALT